MTALAQSSLFTAPVVGVERFDSTWRAQSAVVEVNRDTIDDIIRRRHYLKCWPGVVTCSLAMVCDLAIVGACVFALPPRETMTRYGGVTWELARLWVDDRIPSNAESWLIGKAVRHIRRDHKDVRVLVSYADPAAGHSGGIYRASNWNYDGMTDERRKTPRADYVVDGKRYQRRSHVPAGAIVERIPRNSKHRFVLPIGGGKQ